MALALGNQISRGEIYLVDLDPTRGGEIRKRRPCVIVSPDELNAHLRTFIVAPMTTGSHPYPFRITCRFGGKVGSVVLDQIRTIDRDRFVKRVGRLGEQTLDQVLRTLQEMFAR
jgi:mRNA interferase MazF